MGLAVAPQLRSPSVIGVRTRPRSGVRRRSAVHPRRSAASLSGCRCPPPASRASRPGSPARRRSSWPSRSARSPRRTRCPAAAGTSRSGTATGSSSSGTPPRTRLWSQAGPGPHRPLPRRRRGRARPGAGRHGARRRGRRSGTATGWTSGCCSSGWSPRPAGSPPWPPRTPPPTSPSTCSRRRRRPARQDARPPPGRRWRTLAGPLGAAAAAVPGTADPELGPRSGSRTSGPPGVEGLVAKGAGTRYAPGRREWLKVKSLGDAPRCVAGGVIGALGRPSQLVAGRYRDGELVVVGRTSPLTPRQTRRARRRPRAGGRDHPWPDRIGTGRFGGGRLSVAADPGAAGRGGRGQRRRRPAGRRLPAPAAVRARAPRSAGGRPPAAALTCADAVGRRHPHG